MRWDPRCAEAALCRPVSCCYPHVQPGLAEAAFCGNLGLLGPPSVDPSSVTVIHPLAGKPKGDTARQWVHTQLQ
eukprot:scaffold215912_cov14-Tisochrysis_lutea.AAC.1